MVEGRSLARGRVRRGPWPGPRGGHRRSRGRSGPRHRPGQHAVARRGVVRHLPRPVPRRDTGLRVVVDAGTAHAGYRSGFYSSASTGIRMLDQARVAAPVAYDLPQQIWVGDWNQRHDTRSVHVARDGWPRGRVHQYSGSHPETYGGVTLRVDSNFMDVGRGTVAPADRTRCPRIPVYPTLRAGDRSPSVPVLQCLLGQRRLLRERHVLEVLLLDRAGRQRRSSGLPGSGRPGRGPAHLDGAPEPALARC